MISIIGIIDMGKDQSKVVINWYYASQGLVNNKLEYRIVYSI